MGGGTPCPSSVERGNGCVECTESISWEIMIETLNWEVMLRFLELMYGCCDVCRTRHGLDDQRLGEIKWRDVVGNKVDDAHSLGRWDIDGSRRCSDDHAIL